MTPVTLPARLFAAGWHNVSLASGQDDQRPALYRTVLVEVHGPGEVRLVACDGAMILQTWVAADEQPDPGFDVLPPAAQSILAADPEGLAKKFAAHVLQTTKGEQPDGEPREVTLRLGSLEDPSQPTLMPELDRQALTLVTDDLRVQLPVVDTEFPSWRQHWPTPTRRSPASRCAYSAEFLARFAKFKDAGARVSLSFTTALGPTVVEVDAAPPVTGLLMPIRETDTPPPGETVPADEPDPDPAGDGELVGAGA